MKKLKVFIVAILITVMPMSQARAVVPDLNSVISDVVESTNVNDIHISGADSQHINLAQMITPSQDLTKPSVVVPALAPADVIQETSTVEELETQDQDDNQDLVGGLALPGHHFWTTRKLVITTTLLLSAGLLIGLLLGLTGGSHGSSTSFLSDGSGPGGGSTGSGDPGTLDNLGGGPPGNDPNDPNNPDPTNGDPSDPSNSLPPGGGGPLPGGGSDGPIDNLGSPTLPGSGIPHHPEPSTFLLMGLGLLVPLLRKRGL